MTPNMKKQKETPSKVVTKKTLKVLLQDVRVSLKEKKSEI